MENIGSILFSVVSGILLSQWFMWIKYPEEIFSGDRSLSVIRSSSIARIWVKSKYIVGYIDLGDSTQYTTIKKFDKKCVYIKSESGSNSRQLRHFISSGSWYGGPQYYTARWPIEKHAIPFQRYVSDDLLAKPERFGSILERYWLSSTGLSVMVLGDNEDFHYGIINADVVLGSSTSLTYIVCHSDGTAQDTHLYMIENFLKKPTSLPDERMFKRPIWSTWARYKIYINQSVVLSFLQEIKDNGFNGSHIEIDDTYTTNYGDHLFDPKRFPNPKSMIHKLKASGFRVTSWIHPFVNFDTKSFQEGVRQSYFVNTAKHNLPALIRWWQGIGAMINFSNPEAFLWYSDKLLKLKSLGIDSFKFDAGEACYMPQNANGNPNLITKQYVESAAQFGGIVEVRAAYKNQNLPIFFRMMDKHSYWGFDNGLKSMIPSALHLSIIGYNFILPDMIGGNAMGLNDDWYSGAIPDKELYIRWFQLVTFLQSMQISISPWQYDSDTVLIAKSMVDIHEHYVAPRVIALAKEAVVSGKPIIRPIWWLNEDDPDAFQVEDQFLIGDDIMVAPVVEKGARSRPIYIPVGGWKDVATKQVFKGPRWIVYGVTIRSIPYFERQQ